MSWKLESPLLNPQSHTPMLLVWELPLKIAKARSEVPDSYLLQLKLDFPEELYLL